MMMVLLVGGGRDDCRTMLLYGMVQRFSIRLVVAPSKKFFCGGSNRRVDYCPHPKTDSSNVIIVKAIRYILPIAFTTVAILASFLLRNGIACGASPDGFTLFFGVTNILLLAQSGFSFFSTQCRVAS